MISHLKASSYLKLPSNLYQICQATAINTPSLAWHNARLAFHIGISDQTLQSEGTLALLAGNTSPSHIDTLALAYSGHQFGHYVPQLGDGRALMLGELCDPKQQRWDVQLKGSGPSKYSRQGDGRAPLDAALREAIISTAMYNLGIPSTQTLAVIRSEQTIYRQSGAVPMGILTRIAKGHLRVGSFQYAADQKNNTSLKAIADYAITRHFPSAAKSAHPYVSLFVKMLDRQAQLIAHWMAVGFIHGVMNTDNTSICGETLDFGPCAFMDEFSWEQSYSSIDAQGRYAYHNQATIAHWNCMQFAQSLKPLVDSKQALLLDKALQSFPSVFQNYWLTSLGKKFGILMPNKNDTRFMYEFFHLMQSAQADFTNSFRLLSKAIIDSDAKKTLHQQLGGQTNAQQWIDCWAEKIARQKESESNLLTTIKQANPAYIPRNHIVAQAIEAYINEKDSHLLHQLMHALETPYDEQVGYECLQRLPSQEERVLQTFCGT